MSKDLVATTDQEISSGASAKFSVIEGRAKGRRYKVNQTATIGRSPEATIMLEDPEISRLHARVTRTENGKFEITDLGSRNGTLVNGQRITSKQLAYGDKIRIGPNTLVEYYGFDTTEERIIQKERFEAIGRLTVGIAHDLNNVMAALDASTSFLRNLPKASDFDHAEIRDCLADMSLASVRATELLRAVLSFVRGSSHEHQPVDISALLLEVARMLRYTLDRRISLIPKIGPQIFVHGSRSELHQALLNLCLNARDAMPNGGKLTLQAELVEPSSQPPTGETEGPQVHVTIRDTGMGMDSATQARIFEPFFTTKGAGRGYGLGLATVREIVTMHGGQIAVESAPDSGTRFSILLPAMPQSSCPLNETELRDAGVTLHPANDYTVLLVDDEEIVRRSMARRLRQTGFVVTEADGGAEAIRACTQRTYDLVLLDIDMPTLDGEQTFEELRRISPTVRVAFMSGYSEPTRAVRLKARGAIAMLEKPCNLVVLSRLIQDTERDSFDDHVEDDFESLTRPV